ncbi:hypothetical protein [Bradyrhizobium valentinum]|uniref:hypothetical protein n=1 Tax=Bradyrhizobium valentinum TaxID=1518501 RepID=UPI00070B9D29|nr:hypothetical protein [Bradyrhizobium valentinum]KRQ92471.1 hypothetical protein CQ10_08820 [Bradyrhizobium valentinum]
MTDKSEDWEPSERTAWQPKTPREERAPLANAPLATLRATPRSQQACVLMGELAKRYPRPQAAKGASYAREKTLVDHANAVGAFIADLLAAVERDRSEGWLRCSIKKSDYTGQNVSWRMFDAVRLAFTEAGLVEHKPGYPPAYSGLNNPGPMQGMLTRYRATQALLAACASHGVTPATVHEHFRFEPVMPAELVQLTQPFHKTPNTPKVRQLRADVAALNAFIGQHTLTHPTREIRHLGWVRKFHRADNLETYRWDKGGRLYSYPQDAGCYQHLGEDERKKMCIDGEAVAEVDISSSYLTIFYAWCGQPLDTQQDAYADILGPTKLDRVVAKFFINSAFGNGGFLSAWRREHVASVRKILTKRGMSPDDFDPKYYKMRWIKDRVLQRHPHLERWGGKIRGRVRDWGDLMFQESEIVIGAMIALMDKGIPSLPVHDSLIAPTSQEALAVEAIVGQFRKQIGVEPSLDVTRPG